MIQRENKQLTDINILRKELLSSFLTFARFFFELLTNREFIISKCISSKPHILEVAENLEDVFLLKTKRLYIAVPPGWHKTTMVQLFAAWATAHYPDCRFLFITHSFELSASHTHTIKKILELPEYKKLFEVKLRRDQSAKDFFETTEGGIIAGFGAKGSITGRDAGLPGLDRFSGGLLLDDLHKPDEVHSDTIRDKVIQNYFETIERRLRGINVPVILIGHRLHENDLPSSLIGGADGNEWKVVKITGQDEAGNSRYPEVITTEQLKTMKQKQPYVYFSQYQQEPIPAGGSLFKSEHFMVLDEEPEILATFLTIDTSETEKTYNDATVMSFWGVYQAKEHNLPINKYALHWLDCIEVWVEPKDLEETFVDFYGSCLRHSVQPNIVAIEKKSTGVTLLSVLKRYQGIQLINIDRTVKSKSKTDRYIAMQEYIASRQVTFPKYAKHNTMCINHMIKITANQMHARDDICDTVYDAIDMALIKKMILKQMKDPTRDKDVAKTIVSRDKGILNARMRAYGSHSPKLQR